MTGPKIVPVSDEEIADLEWDGAFREIGDGLECLDCGTWGRSSDVTHRPTCDSIMLPRVKARITQERDRADKAEALNIRLKKRLKKRHDQDCRDWMAYNVSGSHPCVCGADDFNKRLESNS